MNSPLKISLFLLCISWQVQALSPSEICNSKSKQKIHCSEFSKTAPINLNKTSMESFVKWSWIVDKLTERKKFLKAEIDNNKGMLRYLRNSFVEEDESRDWYGNEYNNIRADFKNLKVITNEIDIASKKLNMCFRICSSAMRIENEDHLKKLQKLKIILLSKRPVLAGPNIEELILKESVSDKKFKSALVKTYASYLGETQEGIRKINRVYFKENSQLEFAKKSPEVVKKKRVDLFIQMISEKDYINDTLSSVLSELDWKNELSTGDSQGLACHFYNKNIDFLENKKIKKVGLEVGMLALPFVVGPTFRLGVWGLRGAGLLKWGMREEVFISVSKATAGAMSAAFFIKDSIAIPKKKEECSRFLNGFIETNNQTLYQKFIECNQELSSELLFLAAETTLVGLTSITSIMKSLKVSRSFKEESTFFHVKDFEELTFYLESKKIDNANFGDAGFKLTTKKGDYYVLNLNGPKREVAALSTKYWEFVSETYKERLNLSKAEIESFIRSSKSMEPRTTLLVSTKQDDMFKLRGGVALVDSSKASELLPLEKATGIRIKREKGRKIGEIVRLTVDGTTGDRKLSDELISQLISGLKTQDKLDSVYVYTSKAHQRLYQRMLKKKGMKSQLIHDLDRDVVLRIDLKDF
ncbi:hypothetical protein A9Q84_14295 [Halobacteriovorax marinus]|uniref:Uncharacterized protein n=1 Tax=Halobacteriovorax marinus TaxID=97084 RepID=A0A1Y5F538_9BACT|nr:hypothetical protein A9Q84_14295 [Halobacteriovorax marinus]